jgi:hypothetical protein
MFTSGKIERYATGMGSTARNDKIRKVHYARQGRIKRMEYVAKERLMPG